jgi:hypothetical protein
VNSPAVFFVHGELRGCNGLMFYVRRIQRDGSMTFAGRLNLVAAYTAVAFVCAIVLGVF